MTPQTAAEVCRVVAPRSVFLKKDQLRNAVDYGNVKCEFLRFVYGSKPKIRTHGINENYYELIIQLLITVINNQLKIDSCCNM